MLSANLQVCRYAYELMQTYHANASDFRDVYPRVFVAMIPHNETLGVHMKVMRTLILVKQTYIYIMNHIIDNMCTCIS